MAVWDCVMVNREALRWSRVERGSDAVGSWVGAWLSDELGCNELMRSGSCAVFSCSGSISHETFSQGTNTGNRNKTNETTWDQEQV